MTVPLTNWFVSHFLRLKEARLHSPIEKIGKLVCIITISSKGRQVSGPPEAFYPSGELLFIKYRKTDGKRFLAKTQFSLFKEKLSSKGTNEKGITFLNDLIDSNQLKVVTVTPLYLLPLISTRKAMPSSPIMESML